MRSESELLEVIPSLIQQLRNEVVWKPGAASRHLLKRKVRGHLPTDATLADYNQLIIQLLEFKDAAIYVYYMGGSAYLAVTSRVNEKVWLVIATFDGTMETTFIVENPDAYLQREPFRFVGLMNEVMR